MPFCRKCDEWCMTLWRHTCPPAYEVRIVDYHGDDHWWEIPARDHMEAATKAAARYDRDDYLLLSGGEARAVARLAGEADTEKWFDLIGETVPEYHAYEIAAPAPCDRSPEGGDSVAGSGEAESAVAEGEAPNPSLEG